MQVADFFETGMQGHRRYHSTFLLKVPQRSLVSLAARASLRWLTNSFSCLTTMNQTLMSLFGRWFPGPELAERVLLWTRRKSCFGSSLSKFR